MPEHLRALGYIVTLSGMAAVSLRFALPPALMAREDLARRMALWFAVIATAFVAHAFWLFIALAAVTLLLARRRDANPVACYAFLLLALPEFSAPVPGLGLVNFLFNLSWPRLLSLTLLLPAAWRLWHADRAREFTLADALMLGYVGLHLCLHFGAYENLTGVLREAANLGMDRLLPYFVASRALRDLGQLREVLTAMVVAACLLVPLAFFEYSRHWLLFNSLPQALGVDWDAGAYLGRGDSLRALASAGHALVLGYVFAIALTLHTALRRGMGAGLWWAMAAALGVGLVSCVSKGPWVGAVIGVAVANAAGPGAGGRVLKLVLGGAVAAALVLVSPWADTVIDHLPFIGSLDEGSVTYRQRLFEVSLYVIAENLWFGTATFLTNPALETLRQGQGIIDLVNVYLAVALAMGVVGLSLFVGLFARSLWLLRSVFATGAAETAEGTDCGRALLGALVAVMVMIATMSDILGVPLVYSLLFGLAASHARLTGAAAWRTDDVPYTAAMHAGVAEPAR